VPHTNIDKQYWVAERPWEMRRSIDFTAFFAGFLAFYLLLGPAQVSAGERLRILHVPSYHMTWKWNIDQFEGFKSALSDLDIEYRVVELDTKRESNQQVIRNRIAEARRLIQEWKPHLLYANDDNVQGFLVKDYVNSDLPVVFSGVNRDPAEYDFLGASNVTGVIEHEHFNATINLLLRLKPGIRRIAVVVDDDPTWKGVIGRIRDKIGGFANLEIVDWALIERFDQFKDKIRAYQTSADAIAMLGVFNLKDENGGNVDYETVLRWTVDNSALPDFSFWQSRVDRGTLCAVTVSGYQQGLQAGKMARRILVDGESPGNISMVSSKSGEPVISLARARTLGIAVDSELLLNTHVSTHYIWNK
jgi:ABC-type uncharacterized transport system substrate-binding protein